VEKDTMPQADDRGLTHLEEVFIKELFIFRAAEHRSKIGSIASVSASGTQQVAGSPRAKGR
jgi:hypothetical protein